MFFNKCNILYLILREKSQSYNNRLNWLKNCMVIIVKDTHLICLLLDTLIKNLGYPSSVS